MEPFQLSLNQVNFETYDLGENGSDEEPLHSFSNLVSYDWDLESSENDGAPVKAKKVVPSQDTDSYINPTDSTENSYRYTEDSSIHLYSDSYDAPSLSEYRAADMEVMEHVSMQTRMRDDVVQKRVSLDESTSGSVPRVDADGDETFRAFTETVEALALQRSVIGNANTKPASAEEIEKAIAAAQAKMSQSTSKADDDLAERSKHSVVENGVELSTSTTSHVVVKSSMPDSTDSSGPSLLVIQSSDNRFPDGSEPHSYSSAGDTVALPSGNDLAEKVTTDAELGHAAYGTKQLIRVSADNVVTESASRSGWFWSKKSSEHTSKTKVASVASTRPKTNVPASTKSVPGSTTSMPKSSARHIEPSRRNEKHDPVATDGNASSLNSSASLKRDASDASSLSSSDVENSTSVVVQDHSRFSKHSSVDTLVTSTPVRGNPGTERQVESRPSQQISSLTDATRAPSDAVPNSPLSYAFILPETSIGSPSATATRMSSVSSIQSETVSATHHHYTVETLNSLRQSSTASAEFDEGRYELLLREKAGLEGRLEVLERENSEMLQQQAELKQRAAVAEQQIKTFMSTSQALNADRSAMAVDLETLRQNRARLEAVIMDAHKLLEDKDQELRTLERDLELARLAGEKHLEKVADIRRDATSRDATVRDLKAKITELYVQSQTSDQSRQVLEGELAAVRADIAALMEAKEWYANQLQATQKDRTRLQQEAAAARAETINTNVASERLRAENARIKRNLTEVGQRMLTEKQTLARHLEEIEADMLAREAALTVQQRQVKESSDHQASVSSSHDETEELSNLKAELQRNSERIETVQRENMELSRRLALSQQCVIDRDNTVKSLEHDRETAELRAEAAEQDAALRAASIEQLKSERSELQLQLESASKERLVIDQSLHTLRRDTAILETGFRRMQHDLAAKTAEVEKLSSLKTHRSEEPVEVWPDAESAAGLKGSTETAKSVVDGLASSKMTFADKEIQSDEVLESVGGSLTHKLQDTKTADTQTEESMLVIVTERAEKLRSVDDVVLQSEVVGFVSETPEIITADVGSRIIEHPQKPSSDNQDHLALALAEKSHMIDSLNAELCSVKACLSKTQLELEVANRHRHVQELTKAGNISVEESLVLNTGEDSVVISSISGSVDSAGDVARVHTQEKNSTVQHHEVQLQTDEISSQTDDLRQHLAALEVQLTTVQQELDAAVDQKLQLETAKAIVELEANTTAKRLAEVEKLLHQTQDDLVRLERQLSEADSNSLEVHNSTVQRLESEKLSLQSQLDELTHVHHKDVSRLKSKNLKLSKQLESAAVDDRDEVSRLEMRIQELAGELALAATTKSRLEMQCEESRQRAALDADEQLSQLQKELQKCYIDLEAFSAAKHRLEIELSSMESEHRLAVIEYRQRIEELSIEMRTLQVVVEEQRGCSDEAAMLALELEKERGRLAALEQTHSALKHHAVALEAALAERASSEMESDSAARDELGRRDQQAVELIERVEQLEEILNKERQGTKDLRAQLMTEKGNHIKIRRQLEQVMSEQTQLVADSAHLRESAAELTSDAESFAARELELKMAADRLAAELRAASADRDRLTRELEDKQVRGAAIQDNIKGLEWRLSEKDAEIAAARQRLELVEERQVMEMNSLTQSLQSATAELSDIRDELAASKKERSSLQAKLVQLTTALKSTLAAKVNLSIATETTAELERLLQDVSAPPADSNKPLSFLQATLNGLRGEISCLQTQINEHTSAVQTSSLAWRELEAQVQDLREVCKTSAADRAAAAAHRPSSDVQTPPPRSSIQLPVTGPVVIPGKLVNVTSRDSSAPEAPASTNPDKAASTS